MKLNRIKDSLLHVNNFRKFVGYRIFKAAISSEFKLIFLDQPPKGKVLVLSPHPDDDVIGCGGAIAAHTKQGDEVKIIYLTGANTPREAEARAASKILGTEDLIFQNTKDNEITADKKTVDFISNLIKDYDPKTIYAPASVDPNSDHFETARILSSALPKTSFSGEIFSYEVWIPIHANRLLKIDETFDQKVAAFKKHATQLEARPYLRAMQGLAMYRAGMYDFGENAEAFFSCKKDLYIKLFNLMTFKK